MHFDDEDSPIVEPDEELDALAQAVIGAAIEVHRNLGPGLSEDMYGRALKHELGLRNIPFTSEACVSIAYKGKIIGERRLDLLVGGRLIVELKAVEQLSPVHNAQVLTYLKMTGLKLGILMNFNTMVLKDGLKRIVRS